MARANSLLILGGVAFALLAGSSSAYAQRRDDARDLLFGAMDKGRYLAVEGIILRRNSTRDPGMMQLRMAQATGISKTVVLSPLSFQGVTTLDDGQNWMTYVPDENRVVIQGSPRLMGGTSRRKRAAASSYRFVSDTGDTIAGRKTIVVVATPKSPEMPTRRYWIDSDYPYILKMDVVEGGTPKVLLDTKAITFEVTPSPDAFRITPATGVRRIYLESPEAIRSAEAAKAMVGFTPILPRNLPYGFIIQEGQVVGDKSERFIALRLTDGLASATLYQWPMSRKNPVPCQDKKSVREAHGLRMRLVGDLPEVVLTKLIDAFVKELAKGLQSLSGTSQEDSVLPDVDRASQREGNGPVPFGVSP
jgi:outer membrane lipoprotein-sorting protein